VAEKSAFTAYSTFRVLSDLYVVDGLKGQEPSQPVHDHGATSRSRTKSRRVDEKEQEDSTLVDRKSSQRIDRLI
jgi:hypothetical protein